MRRKRATGLEPGQNYLAWVAVLLEGPGEPEEWEPAPPPPAPPALCPLAEAERLVAERLGPGWRLGGITAHPVLRPGWWGLPLGRAGAAWCNGATRTWLWEPPGGA
jgi:hypothetical protein